MQVKLLDGRLRVSNKILLLEDDLLFAETLIDLLEDASYKVVHCTNGQSAIDITFEQKFDLYLLDINVPLIDGLTLLKELRQASDMTPAIFVTSHKDKLMLEDAFKSGGDDYVMKPFDTDELLLRIEAILRRLNSTQIECVHELCHDQVHKRILYKQQEIDLSQKEYQLLLLLMQHANNAVPKELIITELWHNNESGSDGAIRVYINRLKQLVPEIQIENIRGLGYKLVS